MFTSIGAWSLTIITLFLIYFIFFFILKPLISMKFYTDQGIKMPFFPLFGSFKGCLDAQVATGDFYGHWIKQIKDNPDTQVIGGNFLDRPQVILVDPKLIKEFYKKQENYIKLPKMIDLIKVMMKENLVTSEGDEWKRHRKLTASGFQYDMLRDIVPDVVKIADHFLEALKKGDLNKVSLIQEAETIAGEVVGRFFFGEDFTHHRIQGKSVIAFLTDLLIRLGSQGLTLPYLIFGIKLVEWGVLPKYRKILKDVREFQSFAAAIIEKRKKETQFNGAFAKSESRSLIDILLNQHDNSSEQAFTTQEMVNEFITFISAGSTTTGGTVGRGIYYLSQNPQYKEKLMQEVNKHFADPSKVTIDSLNQMDFMTAFIKETLRFSPPFLGLFEREAARDHTLGDLRISKGTVVNLGLLINNLNPVYHDDVDVFSPERWLTNSQTRESTTQDAFVYVPFSSGARNCIGQHLAMNEARVILSLFLKKYDFELDPDYKHQMTLRIAYEPFNVMNFKLTPK